MKLETIFALSVVSIFIGAVALKAYVTEPKVVEKTIEATLVDPKMPQKEFPIPSFKVKNLALDEKQVIIFNTDVSEQSVNIAIAKINDLQNNEKDIYILLDSSGGTVFDGVRLISYMEAARVPVNTVNIGFCASMCAQIHAHGTTRYMLNRSTLMYHLAAGGVSGTMNNMKSLLSYIDRTTLKLDAYIANRAGIDREKFATLVGKDLWVDAEDAITMRLGDELVTVSFKDNKLPTATVATELQRLNIKVSPTKQTPLRDVH